MISLILAVDCSFFRLGFLFGIWLSGLQATDREELDGLERWWQPLLLGLSVV